MESIVERLKKINALALSGSDGERETARKMLESLCVKHGISQEMLSDTDSTHWREFNVSGKIERSLLAQIAYMISDGRIKEFKARTKTAKKIYMQTTEIECIDIRECFLHYRKLWEKNLDDVMHAFIQANHIFPKTHDDDSAMKPPTEENLKNLRRILSMSLDMRFEPWRKVAKIGEGASTC